MVEDEQMKFYFSYLIARTCAVFFIVFIFIFLNEKQPHRKNDIMIVIHDKQTRSTKSKEYQDRIVCDAVTRAKKDRGSLP